jgi:hypothetical protein
MAAARSAGADGRCEGKYCRCDKKSSMAQIVRVRAIRAQCAEMRGFLQISNEDSRSRSPEWVADDAANFLNMPSFVPRLNKAVGCRITHSWNVGLNNKMINMQ